MYIEDIKSKKLLFELRSYFDNYDKIWVFSPKGDHLSNLQTMGLVKRVDLVYCVSTLGCNAKRLIKSNMKTYSEWLETYEDIFQNELENISNDEKILIVSPFPNRKLINFITTNTNLRVDVVTTAKDSEVFYKIEDKINFSQYLEDALGEEFKNNIIPWKIMSQQDDFNGLSNNLFRGNIFLQKSLGTTGGDGTILINREENFQKIIKDPIWGHEIGKGKVKVTKEIEKTYPSNGTGCIVPIDEQTCKVYIDPPSHKPVRLKEFDIERFDSAGNEWGKVFHNKVLLQYAKLVTKIGEYLYNKYNYTGIFGPDALISDGDNIFINEINPRWQGTTPYQTLNALKNNRLPLEVIHYLLRFYILNGIPISKIINLLPLAEEYNSKSILEKGGFYIKIKIKGQKKVTTDINGCWSINLDTYRITKVSTKQSFIDIFLLENTDVHNKYFYVKGPRIGETVGGELVPVSYVFGSGFSVFDSEKPQANSIGKAIFAHFQKIMFA